MINTAKRERKRARERKTCLKPNYRGEPNYRYRRTKAPQLLFLVAELVKAQQKQSSRAATTAGALLLLPCNLRPPAHDAEAVQELQSLTARRRAGSRDVSENPETNFDTGRPTASASTYNSGHRHAHRQHAHTHTQRARVLPAHLSVQFLSNIFPCLLPPSLLSFFSPPASSQGVTAQLSKAHGGRQGHACQGLSGHLGDVLGGGCCCCAPQTSLLRGVPASASRRRPLHTLARAS